MSCTPNHSFAFQPIVNVVSGTIVSFEALVRGENNESAKYIFDKIDPVDMHNFDELLRINAIPLAAKLGIQCKLNLNLLPGSLSTSDAAITSTLQAAEEHNIHARYITLEISEKEIIQDYPSFIEAINRHRSQGIGISIDDFGAGYSGLNLLAEFQPDNIKLDMSLVRDIDSRGPRQAIVRGITRTCKDLGIDIIAEGVESLAEYWWFREEDIELFQGYLFAKPGFEYFPIAFYPKE
jgi:blue light- and temperature-responsive anti-repressor